jgi:hypothetical protein
MGRLAEQNRMRAALRRICRRRPSPYVRIVEAAEQNRGVNLTAAEAAVLADDHAIRSRAEQDRAGVDGGW